MSNVAKLAAFGPDYWMPGSPTFEEDREAVRGLVRSDAPLIDNRSVRGDPSEIELLRDSLGNLLWTRNIPEQSSFQAMVDDRSPAGLEVVELSKDSLKPIVSNQDVYYSHNGRPELPYLAKLDLYLGYGVPLLIARMQDHNNPDLELVAFREAVRGEISHAQRLIDAIDPYARTRAEMGIKPGHMAEVKQFIPRQTSDTDQTAS